jgi:hypothetical protein
MAGGETKAAGMSYCAKYLIGVAIGMVIGWVAMELIFGRKP